jgi:hypothetical protein
MRAQSETTTIRVATTTLMDMCMIDVQPGLGTRKRLTKISTHWILCSKRGAQESI